MATPEAQREYQRQWVAKRRADFFADKSCVRCGTTEALELDHIDPKTKHPILKAIHTNSFWSWSLVRREAEIAKCQVLCNLCHKEKTIENRDNPHGENTSCAKLTDVLVLEIRARFAEGGLTKRGLGREYGVDEKAIRALLKRETWTHI